MTTNHGALLNRNTPAGECAALLRDAFSQQSDARQLQSKANDTTERVREIVHDMVRQEIRDGRQPVEYQDGTVQDWTHLPTGDDHLDALCRLRKGLTLAADSEEKPVDREVIESLNESISRRVTELQEAGCFSILDPQFRTVDIASHFRPVTIAKREFYVATVEALSQSVPGSRLLDAFRFARVSTTDATGHDVVALASQEHYVDGREEYRSRLKTRCLIPVADFINDTERHQSYVADREAEYITASEQLAATEAAEAEAAAQELIDKLNHPSARAILNQLQGAKS